MTPEQRPLADGFESEYARQLVGVDTLLGGDVGLPEGGAHFIADSFPKDEVLLPPVYRDNRSLAMRKSEGAQPGSGKMVRGFIKDYGLLDARGRLMESLGNEVSPLRKRFMGNMGTAFEVMARTALATSEGSPLPTFEERYRAAVQCDPELVDTSELREKLAHELSAAGIVLEGKELRDAVQEWEQRVGFVSPDNFTDEVSVVSAELMKLTRARIFSELNFGFKGYDPHLADVPFDGCTLKTLRNVRYTMSSAYEGGLTSGGKPALRDLIEYNVDHPVTKPALWHLIAHEMTPGHYIDSSVADLGWHSGKLGLEAVMHTMCTGEVARAEGWAQNSLAMLHGGSEEEVVSNLGREHAVHYLIERLQDAGKRNAAILFQGRNVPIEEVKKYLAVECVLSDPYVEKLLRWAQDPIWGAMYGPAYAKGYEVVRRAIDVYGPEKAAKAALHGYGYLDIDTFPMAFEK